MSARARTVVRSDSSEFEEQQSGYKNSPQPSRARGGYNVNIDAMERGDPVGRHYGDDGYTGKYQHNYHPYWFDGWSWWRWLIVLNTIALIALTVVFIVAISTHSNTSNEMKMAGEIPIGQKLKYVPSSVKLQPSEKKIQTKSYKFNLNGVFSRYPADGSIIKGLKQQSKGTTEFCCNYEVKTQDKTSTKQACASTSSELAYQIQIENEEMGGYMIVTTIKDMVGAQCTLTWSVNS